MSQFDFGNLSSPLSGADFIDNNLEPWRDALYSMHSGTSRPSYAVAGLMWRDTTTNPQVIKIFDGTDDITVGTLNTSTNVFRPSGLVSSSTDNTIPRFDGTSGALQTSGITISDANGIGNATWQGNEISTTYLPTGTDTGDLVVLEDVGGNPGLPAVDGSQLTGLVTAVYQTQITLKTASQTTTATIPNDNTIPQQTEGAEFFTCSITPQFADSILKVEVFVPLIDGSALRVWIGALFRDSTSDAIATATETIVSASYVRQFKMVAFVPSGSTSATTFKFRFGLEASGTAYANATAASGNQRFGDSTMASITVTELRDDS